MKDHMGNPIRWDYGDDFATELLEAIQFVALKEAPFKIETQGWQVYWAGGVLRIDIKKAELATGEDAYPRRKGYEGGE